jgi:hypothetical protein
MTMTIQRPWYEAKMGNDHQGLVIEEATGRNVAVAYDKVDAPLIAAAPDLLAALENYQRLVAYLQRTTNPEEWAEHGDWKRLQREADGALARAKGSR